MSAPLLDAHRHLPLSGAGAGGLGMEFKGAGVGRVAVNSTGEEEWQEVVALARACPEVVPFLGIHPWWAGEARAGWQGRLAALLATTRAGIGEIGLDALASAPAERQESLFVRQLLLAEELALPVAIHCCRRWGRLLELMNATLGGRARVIIHGFGGSLETMHRLLDLGAMLSFGPALAHPAREKLREAFRRAPAERLLLESDWAPRQQAARPGAPLRETPGPLLALTALYRLAAGLKSMDEAEFRALVWNNGQLLLAPFTT